MASRSQSTRLFAELLRPYRRALGLLAVILTAASLLPLAGPQLLRSFIDAAVADAPLTSLLAIAGGYVALGVLAQAATVATTYAATRMAWSATNGLRERAARHALHLDLAFHGGTSPGTLIERIDGDATAITKLFTDVVLKVAGGALMLAGAVVLVSLEDWRVGLAMGVFVAVAITLVVRLRERAVPATTAERAAFADVIGVVEEQLDGLDDLRSLGAGEFALGRHELMSNRHTRALVHAWRKSASVWTSVTGAFAFGMIAMLGGGWLLYERGAITIGTVFLLFQYVQILRMPIENIAEQLEEVQHAGAGAARIRMLLDERPQIVSAGTQSLPAGALSVEFAAVDFAYADDNRQILHGIDVVVPAGTVVGLVGATGSGKTTLARLALRLVDPTAGTVRLGGVDIRDIAPDELRRRVAIVTQDVQLFDASLRDNLTLFADDDSISDAALEQVLRDLGLAAWYAGLPQGLDTPLAAGSGLSAGEAQLLGLGRAFLRNPGLVVLDEASSRVDPVTAEIVEAALDRLLAGRTVLVIAHRLRAVDRADQIVVLDHGRVVEAGPATTLRNTDTVFRTLVALEAEGVPA
jgi:ABC-type multidrug transport system fused ATPase/permease subunit